MQEEIQKLRKKVVYFQEMLESKQSMLEMTISYMDGLQEDLKHSTEKLQRYTQKLEDSNNYAERLQKALLPSDSEIVSIFPNSFVIYRPKHALSGDFYWFHQSEKAKCMAVIDCTGHGVPGAMLTVMIDSALNQIVKSEKRTNPQIVLGLLDYIIHEQLHKTSDKISVQDGADLGFIEYSKSTKILRFSGAHSNCFLVNNNGVKYLKGSRYSIGEYSERIENINNTNIEVQANDRLFMYTDGVVDQFGGEEDRKFGRKRLQELIQKTFFLPIAQQKLQLENYLSEWKGEKTQTDDILLVGIEF